MHKQSGAPGHPEGPDDHSHAEDEPGALLAQAIATAGMLITHIHGIGYSADGGFFSSGHPAATSGLPNPLGFVFVDGTN